MFLQVTFLDCLVIISARKELYNEQNEEVLDSQLLYLKENH